MLNSLFFSRWFPYTAGRSCGMLVLLLVILGAFSEGTHAQMPAWTNVNSIATSSQFPHYQSTSAVSANGDVVIAGTFQGSITFGTLPTLAARSFSDVYVAKMDGQTRQWLWAVRGGGNGPNSNARVSLSKIVIDGAGNILLAGSYTSLAVFGTLPMLAASGYNNERALVAKLAGSNGTWLWATGSAGSSSYPTMAHSLAVDGTGNAVVGGYFGQTAQFGNLPAVTATSQYPSDAYVAGLNAGTGQWQWVTQSLRLLRRGLVA